jgi:hypothetical protein
MARDVNARAEGAQENVAAASRTPGPMPAFRSDLAEHAREGSPGPPYLARRLPP